MEMARFLQFGGGDLPPVSALHLLAAVLAAAPVVAAAALHAVGRAAFARPLLTLGTALSPRPALVAPIAVAAIVAHPDDCTPLERRPGTGLARADLEGRAGKNPAPRQQAAPHRCRRLSRPRGMSFSIA